VVGTEEINLKNEKKKIFVIKIVSNQSKLNIYDRFIPYNKIRMIYNICDKRECFILDKISSDVKLFIGIRLLWSLNRLAGTVFF
jgi:hypothetical protein